MVRFGWIIVLLIIITIISIRQYHKTYNGRRKLDRILLNLPIMGMLLRKIAVARFCSTLSTLTSSGVPMSRK